MNMFSTSSPEVVTNNQIKRIEKYFYRASRTLFGTAIIGQLIFVYYIVAFYGGIAVSGEYERVNEQLPHGIIEGDLIGNIMLGIHLALAAVITFGGPIQFIPFIRKRFPKFHRWNGRIYYLTAFIITFAGLYMNITRGSHGETLGLLGNILNAVLIVGFSVMAWRTAMQRDFVAHKKWALRAFLMVSGVWFFRVGYGIWLLLSGFSGVGMSKNLSGPVDIFLMFGHSLIPLLIIEGYFYAKQHTNWKVKRVAIIALASLSVLLAAGIVMVAMIFWMPKLV